jgi:hypothetical protein
VEKKDILNDAKPRLCTLLFVLLLAVFLFPCSALDCSTVQVSISPSMVAAGQGRSFTVNVTILGVSRLFGWELKLNWTTSYLDAVNVTEGPFLKTNGDTLFTNRIDNSVGHLIADCTLLGEVSGITGDGVLASVTFHVKAAGQCSLDLYYAGLLDDSPEPQSILCQTSGGYWSSTGSQHDVSITDISMSPTAVFPGQIVSINVTADDVGTFSETFDVTAFVNSEAIGQRATTLKPGIATVLPFAWDTTGYEKGDYIVSAAASVVPGETDTANNDMTASQAVAILTLGHDIAVTDVRPSKSVVGKGFCMFINVTVRNFGAYGETFNTTTSANDTVMHTDSVTLASGLDALLSLVWNASGFSIGNYTIKSYADPVGGETNTTDNSLTSPTTVMVGMPGDVVPPYGVVDMKDIAYVAKRFGATPSASLWDPNADFDGSGKVDMKDIAIVAKNFGEHFP